MLPAVQFSFASQYGQPGSGLINRDSNCICSRGKSLPPNTVDKHFMHFPIQVGVMVVEPSSTAARRGCNITLPNMMNSNSNREGTAPDGGPFKTYDFIVHPDTLTRCVGKADLLEHLITTVSPFHRHFGSWHVPPVTCSPLL